MKRHYITVGAHTTAGGVVVSGSSRITINDAAVALEGDKIACRSCKSTGHILCTGPRHPEVFDGKPVALENDFCICGCSPPPRLIPSQSLRFQTLEGQATPHKHAIASAPALVADKLGANNDDDSSYVFHLIDEVNGELLANRRYRLTYSGRVIEGTTDVEGRTSEVKANPGAVKIEILSE